MWVYMLLPVLGFLSFTLFGVSPIYPVVPLILFLFLPYLFKRVLIVSKFNRIFLFYIVIEFISKYIINGYNILKGEYYVFYSAQLILVFLTLVVIDNTRFNYISQERIYRFMLFFLWIAAIVSVLQFTIAPTFLTQNSGEEVITKGEENFRVYSFFGWEGDYKGAMVSIPLIGIILLNRQSVYGLKEVLRIVFPVFLVTFLTGSRAAIVAAILMVYYNAIRFGVSRFIGIIAALVIVASLGLTLLNFNFDSFVSNRLQGDTTSRVLIFNYAFEKIKDAPLLGDGRTGIKGFEKKDVLATQFQFGNKVHNGFLRIMLNYGIIGLLVFILLFIEMFRESRKQYRFTGDTSYRYFVLMLFFLNFTVDIVNFFYSGIFLLWWHSHNLKMKALNPIR